MQIFVLIWSFSVVVVVSINIAGLVFFFVSFVEVKTGQRGFMSLVQSFDSVVQIKSLKRITAQPVHCNDINGLGKEMIFPFLVPHSSFTASAR